jgi:ketosteroid isomerase-like protein
VEVAAAPFASEVAVTRMQKSVCMKFVVSIVGAALVLATSLAAPVAGAENANVMTPIRQFVDGFNREDAKAIAAACAPEASIIDDFPPHAWLGLNACAKWFSAFEAYAQRTGITGSIVTLGRPWQVSVTGDRAYVVVPATYAYKEQGKAKIETGSVFTLALQKTATGWLIAGWAWSSR